MHQFLGQLHKLKCLWYLAVYYISTSQVVFTLNMNFHNSLYIHSCVAEEKIVLALDKYLDRKRVFCSFPSSVQSLSCVRLFATPWTAASHSKAAILWCSAPFPLNINPRNSLESAYLQICVPPNKICDSQFTFHPEHLPFHYSSVDWNNAVSTPLLGCFVVPPTKPFSSVAQSCLIFCDPMDCSTPGFPVHHQLLELSQTHVPWISDTIQPSPPLLSPSFPAFNLSQHQGLFQWVSSLHQVAKDWSFRSASILPKNIQDCFPLGRTCWISLLSKGLSRIFSNTTALKNSMDCTVHGVAKSCIWLNC